MITSNDNDSDDYELDEEFDQVADPPITRSTDPLNLFEPHKSIDASYKNIDSGQLSNMLEELKHISPDKMQKIMGQMTQQFGLDRTILNDSLRAIGGTINMTTADRLRQKLELRRKQSTDNDTKLSSNQSIEVDTPMKKKKRKKNKKKTPSIVNIS